MARIDPFLRQAFYHPESVVYFIGPSVMSKGCKSAARPRGRVDGMLCVEDSCPGGRREDESSSRITIFAKSRSLSPCHLHLSPSHRTAYTPPSA